MTAQAPIERGTKLEEVQKAMDWDGSDKAMLRSMSVYEVKVYDMIRQVADYFAPIIEAYAKENATWIDRTSNARQALHTFIEELAEHLVALYLSHGMEYGLWLEVRTPEGDTINLPGLETIRAGKYAIILPTLEIHFPQIMKMIQDNLK